MQIRILSRSERSGALYNLDGFIICSNLISEMKMQKELIHPSRVVAFFTGGWQWSTPTLKLGTLSILAALDLNDGHVIAQVHKRHRSREFIQLLQEIDDYYPKDKTIRIILDNHSSHISKETMAYLKTRPNRFQYVHTPKHGSWLNLVETLFGKMARTFLNRIRVESISELKDRILQGIQEINENPVIHRWNKFKMANSDL